MEDPDEVLLPSRNLVLITFGVEESGGDTSFTPFNDLPLDISHGSAIEAPVNGSLSTQIICLAHVVSCPIAASTDRVSSSNRLPSTPRSRA